MLSTLAHIIILTTEEIDRGTPRKVWECYRGVLCMDVAFAAIFLMK